MTYARYYHFEDKPFHLNTASKWREYGYSIRKNAPVVSELKTDHRKRRYPLYHSDDIEPIKGKAAMHRRYMQMLRHFRSQVDKALMEALRVIPDMTHDELHDYASGMIDEGYARYYRVVDEFNRSRDVYLSAHRPALDYFNKPYFVQGLDLEHSPLYIDDHHQKRLLNTTLEMALEAIEAGHYHDRAKGLRDTENEKQRKEALEAELIRQCIACIPVHPLSEFAIETIFAANENTPTITWQQGNMILWLCNNVSMQWNDITF